MTRLTWANASTYLFGLLDAEKFGGVTMSVFREPNISSSYYRLLRASIDRVIVGSSNDSLNMGKCIDVFLRTFTRREIWRG